MDFTKTITALKGAKWYLIVFVFLGFTLYTFRNPIEEFLHLGNDRFFKDVPKAINRDVIVHNLLEDLMYRSDADRAYIFRFHNGQNYFDGSHKLRMSCEYEVVSMGIEPQARKLKDIPTSLYPKFISDVIDGNMYYNDIEDIDDPTTRVTLKAQGIKSIAVAPFFDNNGNLIAMIGVDYVGREADLETILKRQGNEGILWNFDEQKKRFIREINAIGSAMLNII